MARRLTINSLIPAEVIAHNSACLLLPSTFDQKYERAKLFLLITFERFPAATLRFEGVNTWAFH